MHELSEPWSSPGLREIGCPVATMPPKSAQIQQLMAAQRLSQLFIDAGYVDQVPATFFSSLPPQLLKLLDEAVDEQNIIKAQDLGLATEIEALNMQQGLQGNDLAPQADQLSMLAQAQAQHPEWLGTTTEELEARTREAKERADEMEAQLREAQALSRGLQQKLKESRSRQQQREVAAGHDSAALTAQQAAAVELAKAMNQRLDALRASVRVGTEESHAAYNAPVCML